MIPEMTDSLGKNWKQPFDIRLAPMDESHVILTQRQYDELLEYSRSMPSGVYPGKCWKAVMRDKSKWLMWYGIADDPKMCTNNYRSILIIER